MTAPEMRLVSGPLISSRWAIVSVGRAGEPHGTDLRILGATAQRSLLSRILLLLRVACSALLGLSNAGDKTAARGSSVGRYVPAAGGSWRGLEGRQRRCA